MQIDEINIFNKITYLQSKEGSNCLPFDLKFGLVSFYKNGIFCYPWIQQNILLVLYKCRFNISPSEISTLKRYGGNLFSSQIININSTFYLKKIYIYKLSLKFINPQIIFSPRYRTRFGYNFIRFICDHIYKPQLKIQNLY